MNRPSSYRFSTHVKSVAMCSLNLLLYTGYRTPWLRIWSFTLYNNLFQNARCTSMLTYVIAFTGFQ